MADQYSASKQGLGYIYQVRFALSKLLDLPEETSVLLEALDDVDFIDLTGERSLVSLKHKAVGEKLTDSSVDFWKSINIWEKRYQDDGKEKSLLKFFLFTTSTIVTPNVLEGFLPISKSKLSIDELMEKADKSVNKVIVPVVKKLKALSIQELADFLTRITIIDNSVRIEDIPEQIINGKMRAIRPEFRTQVFEKLEGWWFNLSIDMLSGSYKDAVYGYEVSDKLALIASEYQLDNLPIEFRDFRPNDGISVENDKRIFVQQLKEIQVSTSRIERAILDYYRACRQRSSWVRENLLNISEIEKYEDRLIDEWERYKDILADELDETISEKALINIGRDLYRWAETNNSDQLRIRSKVTESYVVMGSFHILANPLCQHSCHSF